MNRTKRKRRKKRTEKEQAPTGSERVKVIDMKTGKKVREILFLNQGIAIIFIKIYMEMVDKFTYTSLYISVDIEMDF